MKDVSEDKAIDAFDVLNKVVPVVVLDDKLAIKASHGVTMPKTISDSRDILVVADKNHMVIAIYKFKDDQFICQRGLNDYGNNSI